MGRQFGRADAHDHPGNEGLSEAGALDLNRQAHTVLHACIVLEAKLDVIKSTSSVLSFSA
jgi:hypothetical protein